MEVGTQTRLSFHGVDIINVNFKAIAPVDAELKIDVSCDPKVFYPQENNNIFKIIMDVKLNDERFFDLEMTAVGTFELDLELTSELRKVFVNKNAPAIMFPYIRSFISTFTANLGTTTNNIVIPTQFFSGELEEIKG